MFFQNLIIFYIGFTAYSFIVSADDEYCVAVSKCLQEVADKMENCNQAFVAMTTPENATGCQKEIYDKQQLLAELHEDQARIMAKCINGMANEWNFTCPLDNTRRRQKRTPSMINDDHEKKLKAMLKVVKECKNGEDVLRNAKIWQDKGHLRTRIEIVDYFKEMCLGNTSLDVDDLPGGDPTMEHIYAKVKQECANWTEIVNELLLKYQNREIYTRYQVVSLVQSRCDNRSSINLTDMPAPVNRKLEDAVWKVQQSCSNSNHLIRTLRTLHFLHNDTILEHPHLIADYFNTNCLGQLNLTSDDFPPILHHNSNSTNFTEKNSLTEKLEEAYSQIERRCKNSSSMIREIQAMFEGMKIESTEQIVEYVEQNCDGKANLTVSDLPLIGCHTGAKKMLAKCIRVLEKCPVAISCQQCLEKSSMGQTILNEKQALAKIIRSCRKDIT